MISRRTNQAFAPDLANGRDLLAQKVDERLGVLATAANIVLVQANKPRSLLDGLPSGYLSPCQNPFHVGNEGRTELTELYPGLIAPSDALKWSTEGPSAFGNCLSAKLPLSNGEVFLRGSANLLSSNEEMAAVFLPSHGTENWHSLSSLISSFEKISIEADRVQVAHGILSFAQAARGCPRFVAGLLRVFSVGQNPISQRELIRKHLSHLPEFHWMLNLDDFAFSKAWTQILATIKKIIQFIRRGIVTALTKKGSKGQNSEPQDQRGVLKEKLWPLLLAFKNA